MPSSRPNTSEVSTIRVFCGLTGAEGAIAGSITRAMVDCRSPAALVSLKRLKNMSWSCRLVCTSRSNDASWNSLRLMSRISALDLFSASVSARSFAFATSYSRVMPATTLSTALLVFSRAVSRSDAAAMIRGCSAP